MNAANVRISVRAHVEATEIEEGTRVGPFAVVEAGARLGRNVVIHSHAFVGAGVILEDDVEVWNGAVIGKPPKGAGATARQPVYEPRVSIGAGTSVGPHAIIFYGVTIGENSLIGDGVSIREQCVVGANVVLGRYATINYNTSIGDRTKIMDHVWLAGNMKIGEDVFISGGVLTTNDNDMGRSGYDSQRIVGPNIEAGAVLGAGAILLPNLTVGKEALIAAGSVVTRSVLPGQTVLGVPAKAKGESVLKDLTDDH